jgi:hypothetical protein
LFGNDDAQYGQDRTRLIETNQAFSKGVSVSTRFCLSHNERRYAKADCSGQTD